MAIYGDNQFKLDSLIERNASTPEIWAQQFINIIHSTEVANLITQEANITCLRQVANKTEGKNAIPCTYLYSTVELPECQQIPSTLSKFLI